MFTKIFVLLCALAAVMAYPYAEEEAYSLYKEPVAFEAVPYERVRREVQLQGGGGGNFKDGVGAKIDGSVPVWKSDNGNHEFRLGGGYTGPLGGSGWNDKRISGGYTFRF